MIMYVKALRLAINFHSIILGEIILKRKKLLNVKKHQIPKFYFDNRIMLFISVMMFLMSLYIYNSIV